MGSKRHSPSRRREEIWARWREILAAQRRSGQTQVAYCRAQGLDPTYFCAWKRKLASDTATATAAVSSSSRPELEFLPLVLKTTPTVAEPSGAPAELAQRVAIRVILRNGISVALEMPGMHHLPGLLGELEQISC